jgi:ankyrin repeat protein
MKQFGHAFGNKPLPLHYYLGLDERANPLEELAIDGFTFYQACANGKHDITMAFLLSGFDINATEINGTNNYGYTGLHYAAASGDTMLAQVLCDQGANADSVSSTGGVTPLMLAFAGGFYETCRGLISHGADPRRVDERGEPALFYGAKHPVALHVAKTMLNLDYATIKNSAGETVLFAAARQPEGRSTVLYLCEGGGLDPNTKADTTGETPLHIAARLNFEDVIMALMSKGASPSAASNTGVTPVTVKGCKYTALMIKCARETNKTSLERMTRPNASNLANLSMKQLQHFLVAFTVPNLLLYFGALLPTYIGVFLTFGSAIGFTLVAKFALAQRGRSLATAGWFSGALVFGSYVLVTRIFPKFEAHSPEHGHFITTLWWIDTVLMFSSYAKAVLADPGAVQSSAEMRQAIIENVARDGEAAAKREHYDMTTLVRKPLRSKHCSKTHFTVCRFDHYCVWTGNAIGGGNHRPFVLYCIFQVVSQIIVAYTTFSVLFTYAPLDAHHTFDGPLSYIHWMFNAENTLITYFLVFYNSFVILFVSAVVTSQMWYATRNVTSNEVWFADRYSWMFVLGTRAHSMYDQGMWKNLVDFFWSGNLCAENYTVPKMNEHLQKVTRQYAAKIKSQQAGRFAGQQPPQQQPGVPQMPGAGGAAGRFLDAPSGVVTSGGSPAGDSVASWNSADGVMSPHTPAEALTEMQLLLPQDKRSEMEMLQAMLQQLVASNGASEPTPPATVTDADQRNEMVRKVKTMYRHYAAAMRQAGPPAQAV